MPDKTIRQGDEKSERRDWNFWQRVKNRQQRGKCFFRMKKLPADKCKNNFFGVTKDVLISNDTQPSCPTLASRAMLYIRTAYLR
jgi:hypothetical protein